MDDQSFSGLSQDTIVKIHEVRRLMNMYSISLKNNGLAPATHLRLTMSYPGAKILRTNVDHEDENMTVKNEDENTTVAFLPRVTSGGSFSVNASISRNLPPSNITLPSLPKSGLSNFPLADFGSNIKDYPYPHYEPYSFIATYDQGSTKFNPRSHIIE